MTENNFAQLEKKLNYSFGDKKLLRLAMTHSSYANEAKVKNPVQGCNERLEFLGDSVLSLISSEFFFKKYNDFPEGDLSRIRSGVVSEKALSGFAHEIGLGEYLLLGNGERNSGGALRPSILADAFEAMLAAMYLDGGIEPVKAFLLPLLSSLAENLLSTGKDMDYKSMLQHIVQQEKGDSFHYVTVSEDGPPHSRIFGVEAQLNGNVIGFGKGTTKRAAEQEAAKEALKLFGV